MLTIASGLLKGLALKSPPSALATLGVRPTGQKTRQAIFNILRNFSFNDAPILQGAVVADLFAGAGTLGIEAVSNGAAQCTFVEAHRAMAQVLQQNMALAEEKLRKQNADVAFKLYSADVFIAYERLPKVRVMFADAPYRANASRKLLDLEEKFSKIEENGLLILESSKEETVPEGAGHLKRFDQKIYGDTMICFFIKKMS